MSNKILCGGCGKVYPLWIAADAKPANCSDCGTQVKQRQAQPVIQPVIQPSPIEPVTAVPTKQINWGLIIFNTAIIGTALFLIIAVIGLGIFLANRDGTTVANQTADPTADQTADPVAELQGETDLEESLRSFASAVIPASQEFLDNTPLVRIVRSGSVALKMSVHLKMLDSYDVDVLSTETIPQGVINIRIQSILDSDPLGRKNIKMGSPQIFPLNCKYRDGSWGMNGDPLGELISTLEKAGGYNNPDEEFKARMDGFYRQIESIANPTGR